MPQIIFILSFFGYMIFMIFWKWCTDWSEVGSLYPGAGAPSLITTLVNIALAPGSIVNGKSCSFISLCACLWLVGGIGMAGHRHCCPAREKCIAARERSLAY